MRITNLQLFIMLIIVNTIWGGAFIVLKLVQDVFTLPQILFARVAIAGLIYILMFRLYLPVQYHKGDWKYLIALTLCEPCLLFLFETIGVSNTSASQAGMIVATTPFFVAIAAFIFFKEKISRNSMVGIVAAVAGVCLVSFAGGSVQGENALLGNFFMLCAVLASTTYSMLIKKLCTRYSFLFLSAVQTIGGSLFFLPAAFASPWPQEVAWSAWAGLFYLGFGVTFCVYFVFNYSLTRLKAANVMVFSNLIPVATLILAFIVLDERLNLLQYLGVALVLGGVFFSGLGSESKE